MIEPTPPPLPQTATAPPRGNVLVVAPHPDDEVFGCGGTIALHAAQGDRVEVVILTAGTNGDPDGHVPRDELQSIREDEARAGGAILGVSAYAFWGYPDGYEVSPADIEAIGDRLAEHLRARRPDIVYAPWPGESHSDHFATAQIASRALAAFHPTHTYGYEVWTPCPADFIVDITATVAKKEAAAAKHVSQLRYGDLTGSILGLNRHRSIYLRRPSTHGEAFVLGRVET